jgi:hypothetical protein
MTRTQFRVLLTLSIVAAFLSAGVDFAFPQWTEAFDKVLEQQAIDEITEAANEDFMLTKLIALSVVGVIFVVACVTVTVGLFRFSPWAPRLNLVLTLLALVGTAFMGPLVQSGLASTFYEVSSLLWGAIMVAPYLSPVSGYFARTQP